MTTVSSAQTIALAGLLNGQGLTTSQRMLSELNTFNSQTFVVLINNLYAGGGNSTISNVAGLSSAVSTLPKWTTGRDSKVAITSTITTTANTILINSVTGYKAFATFMAQSAGFCSAVLPWYASLQKYEGQSFSNIGLKTQSYVDLTSGGVTRYFAPLKTNPAGLNQAIKNFAAAMRDLGTAFDFTVLNLTFTPLNFLENLRKQGLGSILAPYLGTLYNETTPRKDSQLLEMFAEVTAYDLTKILNIVGVVTRPGIRIETLAQLFDSKKMLPATLQALTPGGSMTELTNSVGQIGGTYTSAVEFANYLESLVTTENLP
jgi:hypothetical protein